MIPRLLAWARVRSGRPALLIRAKLGASAPDDPARTATLHAALLATPRPSSVAAAAWRAILLMDLGEVPGAELEHLDGLLEVGLPETLPLVLPSGAVIEDAESAAVASEALALRALTKGGRKGLPGVRTRLDRMARLGPGLEGVTRRASALHGIAADAVHYPTAVAKLCTELAGVQRSDGTWGEDDLFHVGQALLAVEHPDATRALRRGAEALAPLQEADGGFGSDERSWIACRWALRVGG